MVAPGVVSLMVTDCPGAYVPAASEMAGVAATGRISVPVSLIVDVVEAVYSALLVTTIDSFRALDWAPLSGVTGVKLEHFRNYCRPLMQ